MMAITWLAAIVTIYALLKPSGINASCKIKFPKGFMFSTGTSAFQTEGAYQTDGRGESIWDNYTHRYPSPIVDGSTSDVACDSYHRYTEDVQLIKEIGFPIHRFSISWPRILPNGDLSEINQAGIQHYHMYIDTLLENGIEPMVTMYHWDLPQKLQDEGGWQNRDIVHHFKIYADLLFKEFGDRVKWWITINEPIMIVKGYCDTFLAPGLNLSSPVDYLVGHNILRTHAVVYRLYDKKYRRCQNGKISIAINSKYYFPAEFGKTKDMEAAERGMQFELGWFAHPIYSKTGDYPPLMREIVEKNSLSEGRVFSRLPYFTLEEKESLRGASDFFGLNHYTSRLCEDGQDPLDRRHYIDVDRNITTSVDQDWPPSEANWLKVAPKGFQKLLLWIKSRYNNPKVFVIENGYADAGQLNDTERISYYQTYLGAMLTAINKYHCNIIGYTTWSLLDNFEMTNGFSVRFGLVRVNIHRADRERTLKDSAYYWREIIRSHCLPDSWQ